MSKHTPIADYPCPACGEKKIKVIESRYVEPKRAVRRRRLCLVCKERWTTYERKEDAPRGRPREADNQGREELARRAADAEARAEVWRRACEDLMTRTEQR